MDRRSLFRTIASSALLVSAGCIDQARLVPGVNETLEIRNGRSEPVALHVTIEKGMAPPEDRPVVFDRSVHVSANDTKSLDVLGDDRYYLTVRMGDETHKFGTRPICDRAYTVVVVTKGRKLDSLVRDCE